MSYIINRINNLIGDSNPKIVFLGTPQFAVPILEKLAQSEFKPVAVFCAPDKPVGRQQILTPPPIKLAAQKYDIPIFQPNRTSDFGLQTSYLKPDLIISAAYGLILPKDILNSPKYGCLNIHPSLLPKYRGPSPIQAAILNGDSETGVTIFKMDENVDTGPIIASQKIQLSPPRLTTPELSKILAELGAQLLYKILPDWLAGKITPKSQDEFQASWTEIIKKEDGLINWRKSAQEIERQIRAYQPWPGAFTKLKMKNEKLKIIEADILEKNTSKKIGELFLIDNSELAVQTGEDALIIKKLQLAGGKPLTTEDFLRGHPDIVGQILN
jgi:methionyl-tRNA formyltransferase